MTAWPAVLAGHVEPRLVVPGRTVALVIVGFCFALGLVLSVAARFVG